MLNSYLKHNRQQQSHTLNQIVLLKNNRSITALTCKKDNHESAETIGAPRYVTKSILFVIFLLLAQKYCSFDCCFLTFRFYGNVRDGSQIMRIKSGSCRQLSWICEAGLTYQKKRYFSTCKRVFQIMEGIQAGKKAAAIAAVDNHVNVSFYFQFGVFACNRHHN